MAEFHSDRDRRIAYVAVGTDGKAYTVTGQYGQPESLLDKVYRAIGAVAVLPGIFYMGNHGVVSKAKKRLEKERGAKKWKHMGQNTSKSKGK